MNATFERHRAGRGVLATFCACVILILAGNPLAVSSAQAQSTTPTTTLQGGVQQNATTGDVFNGSDSGPTNTNQPGVGGPACQQVDPECGGTNRQCYNQAYHSTGIVISVAKSQSLYQQTGGQIWIRCGACRSNVICWPRPGYQDLIAGRASGGGPGPNQTAGQSGPAGSQGGPPGGAGRAPMPGPAGGIGYTPGPDPCKPKGPGGYDYCANGPGARLPPGCFCGSAIGGGPDPTLAGYVDSAGKTPGESSPEGIRGSGTGGKDPGTPGPSHNNVKGPWEAGIYKELDAEFRLQLPEYFKKDGAKQAPIKSTVTYVVKKDYVPGPKGYVPWYRVQITQQKTAYIPGGYNGTWNLTPGPLYQLQEDFRAAVNAAFTSLETNHQDVLAFPYGLDAPNNEIQKDATFTSLDGTGYHLYRP